MGKGSTMGQNDSLSTFHEGQERENATALPSVPLKRKYIKKRTVGTFEFVGVRARSRNGCLNCRKRSKKCDEQKPVCGLCTTKHRTCEWPNSNKSNHVTPSVQIPSVGHTSNSAPKEEKPLRLSPTPKPEIPRKSALRKAIQVKTFPAAGTTSPIISVVDFDKQPSEIHLRSNRLMGINVLTPAEIEELDFTSDQELNGVDNIRRFLNNTDGIKAATRKLLSKRSVINQPLDQEVLDKHKKFDLLMSKIQAKGANGYDIALITEFCRVSKDLCSFDARHNTLLVIILSEVLSSQLLMNSLLAWGAISRRLELDFLLEEIKAEIKSVVNSESTQNNDCINPLSVCLLLSRAFVLDGKGPSIWFDFLISAKEIIIKFELLDKIDQLPDKTRFLLSYFCLQDLHASVSYCKGTLLSYKTCEIVFANAHGSGYPPVDCLEPLFPYIGEVIELTKESRSIYELLKDPKKILNWVYTEKFNTILWKAAKLDQRIHETHPLKKDLGTIKIEEFEIHLSLYELHQFSIQLNLRIYVRGYPPVVPENQILLVKLINLLRFLVNSSVRNSLYYAFLIVGMTCVLESDREEIRRLLASYKKVVYSSSNIEKIETIINQSWLVNPDGLLCVNWFDIMEDLGWVMNLS